MKQFFYDSSEPIRLDKVLSNLSSISRTKIQELIRNNQVKVNNKIETNPSTIISYVSDIQILENQREEQRFLQSSKIDFEVIFEDQNLLVINKPAGLTVHPGAGNYNDTLVNGLIERYGENLSSVNTLDRPGIVHRIDKDTSGLLLVAKTNEAHISLAKQIENKTAKRLYRTIVWGLLLNNQGSIKTNIGRSDKDRTKMRVLEHGGKEAITHFKTLEILNKGLFSLVECALETGRTHQIRVHMSHIGHSILGDQTYGSNERKIKQLIDKDLQRILLAFKRQALHAYKLSFTHPSTKKEMTFEIDFPDDINLIIQKLRESN